jgi:hypothetical protein
LFCAASPFVYRVFVGVSGGNGKKGVPGNTGLANQHMIGAVELWKSSTDFNAVGQRSERSDVLSD